MKLFEEHTRRPDPEDRAAVHAEARLKARRGDLYGAYELLYQLGFVEDGDSYALELGGSLANRERPILEGFQGTGSFDATLPGFAPRGADRAPPRGPVQSATLNRGSLGFELVLLRRFPLLKRLSILNFDIPAGPDPTPFTREYVAALSELTTLRALCIVGYGLGQHADRLARLSGLTRLELGKTAIHHAALLAISQSARLTQLSLTNLRREQRLLEAIAELNSLDSLDLQSCELEDPTIAPLARLSGLRALDLSENPITDEALASLAPLQGLEELYLSETPLRGCDLAPLASLKGLRRLSLEQCPLLPGRLGALAPLTRLEVLNLGELELDAQDLRALAELPALRVLFLDGQRLDRTCLRALLSAPALEFLSLREADITPEAFAILREAPRLKEIRVPHWRALGALRGLLPERIALS